MIFKDSKVYDVLKFIALIVLPAAAVLWQELGNVWGWPLVSEITATICAVDAFMGCVLQISSAKYSKQQQLQPPDQPEEVEKNG